MYKYKIELVTTADILEFVGIVSAVDEDIKLIDGNGFCVNAKSILGVMASVEWKSLYCLSERNIYTEIEKFCIE
jgi:hypothetical protein